MAEISPPQLVLRRYADRGYHSQQEVNQDGIAYDFELGLANRTRYSPRGAWCLSLGTREDRLDPGEIDLFGGTSATF